MMKAMMKACAYAIGLAVVVHGTPAQAAAARGVDNVRRIDTRDFYRPEDESPGRGYSEHWFRNAESYFRIGDAMGKAMKQMLSEGEK